MLVPHSKPVMVLIFFGSSANAFSMVAICSLVVVSLNLNKTTWRSGDVFDVFVVLDFLSAAWWSAFAVKVSRSEMMVSLIMFIVL